MPHAYLVEIHQFFSAHMSRARHGLETAVSDEDKAYYRGMLDEVTHMRHLVSKKYNMNFHDYGEAV